MQLFFAPERSAKEYTQSLFLAGPSPRGNGEHDWRQGACTLLRQMDFKGAVYVPLPRDGVYSENYDHAAQIDWELEHLEKAGAIVFWVPRDLKTLPGFTTNVEFGRYSRSGRAVLGYPKSAPRMRYLHYIAYQDGVPVFHTLEETIAAALEAMVG